MKVELCIPENTIYSDIIFYGNWKFVEEKLRTVKPYLCIIYFLKSHYIQKYEHMNYHKLHRIINRSL